MENIEKTVHTQMLEQVSPEIALGSHWKDYKGVRLQSIYYGAFFDDNQSLID